MSNYFSRFPTNLYKFGSNEQPVLFQNLTAYVDIVDRLKDNIAFYEYYYIIEGDRPDQVSMQLYGTTNAYWTFFIFNNNIRERGWPLTEKQLVAKAKKEFPNQVLTTRDSLTGVFKVGTSIEGSGSGSTGTVIHRNLDLGQLTIKTTQSFLNSEVIRDVNSTDAVTLVGSIEEYNSIAYYKNADGRIVDVDPYGTPNSLYTPVTQIEKYREENDNLKKIKVPTRDNINDILIAFQRELTNA